MSIRLNDGLHDELKAKPGEPVTLEYYLWDPSGRLVTKTASFRYSGTRADRRLAATTCPRVSRHLGCSDNLRLGPAIPDEPRPHSQGGRGLLGPVPGDPEGIHPAGGRAKTLAIPLRRCYRYAKPRRQRATALRPSIDPMTVYTCRMSGKRAWMPPRRHGFRRVLPVFQLLLVVAALLLAGMFFRFGIEQRCMEISTFARSAGRYDRSASY